LHLTTAATPRLTDGHALGKTYLPHICGNIDPSGVLALGSPELVAAKTRELLDIFAGNPRFILNAGCAIPPATPPANLRAMLDAAR